MLTKTIGALQSSWKGWGRKKKLILLIPIIILIVFLCIVLFWDTKDDTPDINQRLEDELDRQFKDKIKEQDDKIEKLEKERQQLEKEQQQLEAKRVEDEKKLKQVAKDIDGANTIDELRAIHRKLLSGK